VAAGGSSPIISRHTDQVDLCGDVVRICRIRRVAGFASAVEGLQAC